MLIGLSDRLVGYWNRSLRISGNKVGSGHKWKHIADAMRMAQLLCVGEGSLGVGNTRGSFTRKRGRDSQINLCRCLEIVREEQSQRGMLLRIIKSHCILELAFRRGQFSEHE